MMQNAKDRHWKVISGIEAIIEQGLAQQYRMFHSLGIKAEAD